MLSTLNHYQRFRKKNNELIQKACSDNEKALSICSDVIRLNQVFANKLPFPVFPHLDNFSDIKLFFSQRKGFDDNLLRLAISYSLSKDVKLLISNYISCEYQYCQVLLEI